jgi:hypothetical protein
MMRRPIQISRKNSQVEFEGKRKTAINKLHYSMLDYVERKRISFPVNWMSVKFFSLALTQPFCSRFSAFHSISNGLGHETEENR